MSYGCKLEDLLAILHDRTPAKADALALQRRRVEHGLLSVGLKIHYLADSIRENDGEESPARFVGRVDGDGFRDNRNALAVEEMGSRGRAALIMGLAS